ncbi:hypothetical protein GGR50DRAFT_670346 [Xylaria sp. CBS 124048]|nr:hypothetical protein GGR50DRAFT_670346 [Xylaria sp. CBS 124048]
MWMRGLVSTTHSLYLSLSLSYTHTHTHKLTNKLALERFSLARLPRIDGQEWLIIVVEVAGSGPSWPYENSRLLPTIPIGNSDMGNDMGTTWERMERTWGRMGTNGNEWERTWERTWGGV